MNPSPKHNELVSTLLSLITSHFERVKIFEAQKLFSDAEQSHLDACTKWYWYKQGDMPSQTPGAKVLSSWELLTQSGDSSSFAVSTASAALYKLAIYQTELSQAKMYCDDLEAFLKEAGDTGENLTNVKGKIDQTDTAQSNWHELERKVRELKQRARGVHYQVVQVYKT